MAILSEGVQTYSVGLVCASACAPTDLSREDVERVVSLDHPTGLAHGWKISDDPTFRSGHPNPCPCDQNPDRQHWLLNC